MSEIDESNIIFPIYIIVNEDKTLQIDGKQDKKEVIAYLSNMFGCTINIKKQEKL